MQADWFTIGSSLQVTVETFVTIKPTITGLKVVKKLKG